MSAYESIIKGLNEAIQYEKSELNTVKVNKIKIAALPHYHGEQIRMLRMNKHLTQLTFAKALGVSKKTVEAWETGRNKPAGPAQRIFEMMERDENLLEKNEIITLK